MSTDVYTPTDKNRPGTDGVAAIFGVANVDNSASLTITERGSGTFHSTKIVIDDLDLGATTGTGSTAKGMGKSIYTFPAGHVMITSAHLSIATEGTAALNNADTPEMSLGSVVCTGAVATMTTATWEDILTAQVLANCTGTAKVKFLSTDYDMLTAGTHEVYLNIADTWAGVDAGMKATGTVIINWILNT